MISYILSHHGFNDLQAKPKIDLRLGYNTNAVVLLQLVVKGLEAPLPQDSLGKTLKLAYSPEADALRHKIKEWFTLLERGEWGSLARVKAEIKRAIASLEMRKQAQQWGDFIVHATVPVSMVEAILEVKLAACYNSFVITGMELLGNHLEKFSREIEKQYRWALFSRT